MDDNGLDFRKIPHNTAFNKRSLGLSNSEPRFQSISIRSTPGNSRKEQSTKMSSSNLPDENFAAANYQPVRPAASGGISFDAPSWQSAQIRVPQSRHIERPSNVGQRHSGDYLVEPSMHRHKSHGHRSQTRSRHLSGTSHPPLQAANTGWNSFSDKEQYQSYASLGIGFASLVAETLLSHPCIVLRRQCQVMNDSQSYHLMPFSLMPVIYNLHKSQGIACLWKGIGSIFIVRGLHLVTENLVSEVTNFPKEVNRHSSTKKLAQHLCLKAVTWALVSPFYAASLVETVQSDIASDSPGVLDCLKEGAARLMVFRTPAASSNLLPFWKLIPPVLCLGVASYAIRSLANYAVMRSVEAENGAASDARRYRGYRGKSTEVDSELYERFYPELLSSFVGALLSDLLLFPLETLTHRLCVQGTRTLIDSMDTGIGVASLSTAYTGLIDAFVTTVRLETPLSLYRGFGALVMQFGAHLCLLRVAKMSYERVVDAWGGGDRRGLARADRAAGSGDDTESTSSRSYSDADEAGHFHSSSGQFDSA